MSNENSDSFCEFFLKKDISFEDSPKGFIFRPVFGCIEIPSSITFIDDSIRSMNCFSVAKPPLKLTSFKSAEKRIIKAKKYDKKGKKKKALKLYEEALDYLYEANKIEPLEPRILNYLGLANKKIGKLDDAEIYLIMGLEIEPENNEMNKNLGILYVATNRIDEANERLNILNKCNCQEYSELNSIIKNSK